MRARSTRAFKSRSNNWKHWIDETASANQLVARSRKPDGLFLFATPMAKFLTIEHPRTARDLAHSIRKGYGAPDTHSHLGGSAKASAPVV